MKEISTREAVGLVLAHDITRIVKDGEKGVAFRKGHIVRAEDVEALHRLGKFSLFVWEAPADGLHEDEAAEVLRQVCQNEGMAATEPREGKINILARRRGLFRVDTEKLAAINALGEICLAARHTNTPVEEGERLAGARVIPLVVAREKMDRARALAGAGPIFELRPYQALRAGLVTTGREVAEGLIEDTFTPVVVDKLAHFGLTVLGQAVVDDCRDNIAGAIRRFREAGADMIVCTGGMSVDPDDRTPGAVADSGARVVSYGAPVLPGAMFLLAYFEDGTPVLGLPGCVMYERRTIFDLVLPQVAAGVRLTARDLTSLGHGGLCLQCEVCRFPACSFGKGA